MFKHLLLFAGLFFIALFADAQTANLYKYKDKVFPDITIVKDLNYAPNGRPGEKTPWLFDLYQPKGDDSVSRPLIIWMHGGGFKFGTKEAKEIRIWSKTFAQRGYVCAAINYRLSKKNPLLNFSELKKSCYYGVKDAKMAVQYFKQCYAIYNIDTNKIILAGNSAGGIIALQATYSTNTELAKMAGVPDTSADKQGLLKVAGVINFWGAIFDLDWLKNARVPIVSVLGNRDYIVPPTHKGPPLYGGVDIHQRADVLGTPNELKVFYGYSHQLQKQFNPLFAGGKGTQKRWLGAGQFAADFLYKSLFK